MTDIDALSAAEIQRDIDEDRERIEKRLDDIQNRLSPGQLVDEALAYLKGSGGAEYLTNLGTAVKGNPIPMAMMGVSLAWLMAGNSTVVSPRSSASTKIRPYATVTGEVWRIDTPEDTDGRYAHFADDAGKRFKALRSSAGKRAGDFMDETGNTYRGFADSAGNRISAIKEQTGALWDDAAEWLSETWDDVSDAASDLSDRTAKHARSLGEKTQSAGESIRNQTGALQETIITHFRDQPLVGGALAFAVGAALGASLPNTEVENRALGEASDQVKEKVSDTAGEVIAKGRDAAAIAYDQAIEVADEAYDAAAERLKTSERETRMPPKTGKIGT